MSGWLGRWMFALLVLLRGTTLPAQDVAVALQNEAAVRGETIRLADLLPLGVGPALRVAAEKISLGRAPEPGSVRVFSNDELRNAVAGQIAVTFPAAAVVRGAGWPLRDAEVRRALRESAAGQGYDFSRAELVPPAGFSTRNSDPRLEVLAIRAGNNSRELTASLRCQQRSDCGSFFVEIVFAQPALAAVQGSPARRDRAGAANSGRRNSVAASWAATALVQPGRPASLRFEGAGFTITSRVFPLRRAGLGEMVRVLDPAARHVSLARVEGKDRLSWREAR